MRGGAVLVLTAFELGELEIPIFDNASLDYIRAFKLRLSGNSPGTEIRARLAPGRA